MSERSAKNLAVIQARTGSSRLPGKILMELSGKPVLYHVIERVSQSRFLDKIIVATTDNPQDDLVENLCKENKVEVYRGSESDVLDRYYKAVLPYQPENIVRITSDCPLIDPEVIDLIISRHLEGNFDYTSNTLEETYPDGLDVEVFTFEALKTAWENAKRASEREHVTPYIKFHDGFRRCSVIRQPSLAEKRWTLDERNDYNFISSIYDALYDGKKIFNMEQILEYLQHHKELEEINKGILRNEGYLKSSENDSIVKV